MSSSCKDTGSDTAWYDASPMLYNCNELWALVQDITITNDI
jgi:hypothetical protein